MTINVLFFASLREATKTRELSLSLPDTLSTKALADKLEHDYVGLSLKGSLCAINEHYAEPDDLLNEGDTVAFFPPVSGG